MKSVLHGTCLLKGNHPLGSALARECPVLRRQDRQERRVNASQGVHSGTAEKGLSEAFSDADLHSELRDAEEATNPPLSQARRKRGRPASLEPSRYSRYRRKHPEYREREAERLKARKAA